MAITKLISSALIVIQLVREPYFCPDLSSLRLISQMCQMCQILLSKVILVDGAACSVDIYKSENYTFQFDPKNREADSYQTVLSKFYVQDVVEVNTKHQYINLEMGIVLGWRRAGPRWLALFALR